MSNAVCESELSLFEPVCYCGESVPLDSRIVNGKPMPSFGLEQLMQLVNEALAQTKG